MGFKTNDRVFKEVFDVFHIVYITIKFLDIVYTTWSRPFSVYSVARVKRTINWKKIKNKKEDVSALRGTLGAKRYFSCASRVPRSTPKNFFFAEFFFLVRPTSPKKGDFLQSRQTENGTQEKSVKEKAAIQTAKQLVEVPAKFKWD